MRFGFDELELHRITARCVADNTASAQVLWKLGMGQEGRLRDHTWFRPLVGYAAVRDAGG